MAPVVTMRQLLEAGVHFGHQTRRWNPKMKRFIYGERNGIYIIDLQQSLERIEVAYSFVRDLIADGGTILFVGTKKQAQDGVQSYAEKCGMPYINERWLGGMLTNFSTISGRVKKMTEYQRMRAVGDFEAMPKKEALLISRELEKLERNLGGIRDMTRLPAAVWVVDTRKEHIAVTEARKLGIPVVAILDTNCDPDEVDYPIPGNDDAIRAGSLLTRIVADAVAEGLRLRSVYASEAAGKEGEAAIAASPADEEPLAEWERELLESESGDQAETGRFGRAADGDTAAATPSGDQPAGGSRARAQGGGGRSAVRSRSGGQPGAGTGTRGSSAPKAAEGASSNKPDKPEPESETQAEAPAQSGAEASTQSETSTESSTQPATEASVEPEASTEAEVQASAEPESSTEAGSEARAESSTRPDTGTEAQPETGAEGQPDTKAQPEETPAEAAEEAADPTNERRSPRA